MAIEIVDFPIKNGDFPWLCDSLPGRVWKKGDGKSPFLTVQSQVYNLVTLPNGGWAVAKSGSHQLRGGKDPIISTM